MKIGMDHNSGLSGNLDVPQYLCRDLFKHNAKLPYEIVRDEIFGRHMVAARDIKPGEVIFVESPVTFGPMDTSKPVCLGCYKTVNKFSPKCSGCHFPCCSLNCSQTDQMFQKQDFKAEQETFNFDGPEIVYSMISPLRALMLKEKNPEQFELIWMQMSHDGERRKSEFWKARTKTIMKCFKKCLKLSEDDLNVIEILLGIFLVNDFEVSLIDRGQETTTSSPPSIRAIFGLASMPNHSCVPNTTHDFSSLQDGFKMTVRAVLPIKKGEDVTHSYAEPLDNVLTRRSILKLGKFFQCNCIRCNDSTEMGTYTSAIYCQKCHDGIILSSNVNELEADWECIKCKEKISKKQVEEIVEKIKISADTIEPSEIHTPTISEFELFLKKHSKVLHPNHVIMVDKKYTLAKMYGRMKGFEADEMTDEQFNRKRVLCEEVLKVFDKIIPGRTRKRGMMMYELHLPLVMMSNRALQKGPACGLDPSKIKSDLKSGLLNLRMGLEILKDEPEESFERKIVEGSKGSVEQLEQWVKTVCEAI